MGKVLTKGVFTLMSGTMVAQVIPVVISPILTRIYSPEEFGTLALYLALLLILSVVANLRYEQAIVQPESEADALALVYLCFIVCGILTSIFFVFVVLYDFLGWDFLGLGGDSFILYILPLAFMMNGLLQAGRYWFLRGESYKNISGMVVSQSSGGAVGQVSLGGLSSGLIIGQFLGQLSSFLFIFVRFFLNRNRDVEVPSLRHMIIVGSKYKNMPIYSAFGAFVSSLSMQLPVLAINKIFDIGVVGFYSLTFKVINLPLFALSTSIFQVLYKKVAVYVVDDPQKIKPLLIKTNFFLILVSIPFVAFFILYGEPIFAFVFGEAWREAGSLAGVLSIIVAIKFCVTPLSSVLEMNVNTSLGVMWQTLYFSALLAMFYLFNGFSLHELLTAIAVYEFLIHCLLFFLIMKGVDRLQSS